MPPDFNELPVPLDENIIEIKESESGLKDKLKVSTKAIKLKDKNDIKAPAVMTIRRSYSSTQRATNNPVTPPVKKKMDTDIEAIPTVNAGCAANAFR